MRKTVWTLIGALLLISTQAIAALTPVTGDNAYFYAQKPWSISGYIGRATTSSFLEDIFVPWNIKTTPGTMYGLEVGYQLSPHNIINKVLCHVGAHLGLALNTAYQNDPNGKIYMVAPYLKFSWSRFPWRNYLFTTISLGEGVSYANIIPREETDSSPGNPHRYLNLLIFEVTFALPKYPQLQLAYKIYHRSPAWGTFSLGAYGSNVIGMAINYYF